MIPSRHDWRCHDGSAYRPCHALLNFGIFRRDVLAKHPWDEDLPINGEHREWYFRLWRVGAWRFAWAPVCEIDHHRDRPEGYAGMRTRKFAAVARKKMGLRFGTLVHDRDRERPNIVVLGVGHANTSITTRQLHVLGWQAGDADEEFAESVSVREINQRFLKTGQFDQRVAATVLARLPEPWVIKDPRFAETLSEWLPALVRYRPLLLWVTKDQDRVIESYVRRGNRRDAAERRVRQRESACARHFACWPWPKVQFDAHDITSAVSLFDSDC
jgi:hypothetical protein